MDLEQKKLKDLVKRRHPEYDNRLQHWNFLAATYAGGREWFKDHIFRYFREGDQEYRERVQRAYRFNHSREVVNLINKYIFREGVSRATDAPEYVQRFWARATRQSMTIDELMSSVDIQTSIYGRIWMVVDSTMKDGAESVADEKRSDARPYAYWISPQQMLDFAYDDDGELLWALIAEVARDDADPFASTGQEYKRYRLWTRESWLLIRERPKTGRTVVLEVVDHGLHGLGRVPVFPVDCMGHFESNYFSPSLIDDISYLDRAVANYLSNLDAIIQDQTFSQLVIPAQGVLPGDDTHNKIMEFGTKRVFTYDGEGGVKPEYISPDPKQASMIIQTVQTIINEIYHSVGVAGERTKQDNAKGIDNSSGAAKAYDFQRVNSLLVTKADRLQRCERQLLELVALWMGETLDDEEEHQLVTWPESFDVRGLMDEFAVALELSELSAPDSVRRYQMGMLVEKIFPNVSGEMRAAIEADLKAWPPAPVAPVVTSPADPKAGLKESEKPDIDEA